MLVSINGGTSLACQNHFSRQDYFPNPESSKWIFSKLFQVGKLCNLSICGGGQGVGGRSCNLPSVMSNGRALC